MLKGILLLNHKVDCIPALGITEQKVRVELIDPKYSDEAWISLLEIIGELPLHEGEQREVNVSSMSSEFLKRISVKDKIIDVHRGSECIGILTVI